MITLIPTVLFPQTSVFDLFDFFCNKQKVPVTNGKKPVYLNSILMLFKVKPDGIHYKFCSKTVATSNKQKSIDLLKPKLHDLFTNLLINLM